MKRNGLLNLLFVGVSGALLVGCTEQNQAETHLDEEQNSETIEEESTNKTDSTDSHGDSKSNQTESSIIDESNEENQEEESILSELEMDTEVVLLPTHFPNTDQSSVTAEIVTNEADQYTISYSDEAGEELVQITGMLYDSTNQAQEEIDTFSEDKEVEAFEEGSEDLGYGITGYGEGAAGTQYFSWREGNWLFSIKSVSEDEMNNPEIARKMVEFLEEITYLHLKIKE